MADEFDGCGREHEKLWERIEEMGLHFDMLLREERNRAAAQWSELAKEVRTYILENIRAMTELCGKTDAIHKRMDNHAVVHEKIDERFDGIDKAEKDKERNAREESKILKGKRRDWFWGIVASLVVNAIGWLAFLVYLGWKVYMEGGKR